MDNSLLPLGILLLGVAAMAGFMAFRPWPVGGSGSPISPGAYVVETLQGKPPAASTPPDRQTDITVIEGGIMALVAIWAAGKIAGLLSPLIPGGGGGEAAPAEPAPGEPAPAEPAPAAPAEPAPPEVPALPEIPLVP